jgi:hypothetical protein
MLLVPQVPREGQVKVSVARWCDYNNHAFKGGVRNTVMLGVITNDKGDQDVREMCPECAAELGLIDDYTAPEPPALHREKVLKELEGKARK